MNLLTKKLGVMLATGFGLGYSPFASGTVGSVWGVGLVWAMQYLDGLGLQILVAVILTLIAIPICDVAEKHFQKKDDGRIVADEYLTFPICMLGLPFVPWLVVVAFLSNRFFDILKFPPANQLQSLKGGLGIVVDDVAATLYSLAFNHLVYFIVTTYLLK